MKTNNQYSENKGLYTNNMLIKMVEEKAHNLNKKINNINDIISVLQLSLKITFIFFEMFPRVDKKIKVRDIIVHKDDFDEYGVQEIYQPYRVLSITDSNYLLFDLIA